MNVSPMHASWLVRRYCSQFVEETPAVESAAQHVGRAIRTNASLTASIGARVNPIFMREVIRLFEELHEVHTGEHPDIEQNQALTVNNVPDLVDTLQASISAAVADLLNHTEPLTRAEDKVMV